VGVALKEPAPWRLAERAMDAVRAFLVSRASRLLLLLDTLFDRTRQESGSRH
jgi:hypothetical protein